MLISTATATALEREATHLVDDQPYTGREYIGSAPKPGTADYGKSVAGDDAPVRIFIKPISSSCSSAAGAVSGNCAPIP